MGFKELIFYMSTGETSKFKAVFNSTPLNDGLYFFLQLIYRVYPEDAFHYAIAMAIKEKKTDEEIYKEVLKSLPEIKPFLQKLTYIRRTNLNLKKELQQQTANILSDRTTIDGYLQLGGSYNYTAALKKKAKIKGYIMTPGEKSINGSLEQHATLADRSVDVVALYKGLHFYTEEQLKSILGFAGRVLRKGGAIIIREYDVANEHRQLFLDVIHSVINLANNVSWPVESKEYRVFKPATEWSSIIAAYGFKDTGKRLIQQKDPTLNTLMAFVKE